MIGILSNKANMAKLASAFSIPLAALAKLKMPAYLDHLTRSRRIKHQVIGTLNFEKQLRDWRDNPPSRQVRRQHERLALKAHYAGQRRLY